jgi:hypothetical protein
MHPEDPGAPFPGQRAGGRGGGVARSTGRLVTSPRKRLRDGPTYSGRSRHRRASSPSSRARFCAGVLPKPSPGSTATASGAIPADAARSSPSRNSFVTVPSRSSPYSACAWPASSRPVPRECMSTSPAPALATTPASAGSSRSPETSFTTAAPASSAARATPALIVSIDTDVAGNSRATSSMIGMVRRSSSS